MTPDVGRLADDPRFSLHDGRFEEVVVDVANDLVTLVIDCGDLQTGYRRLTLRCSNAVIEPDNLQLLAEAVGAEFRANHWHRHRTVTEVIDQKVEVLGDGRFALKLRLWPFYRFAVEFGSISMEEVALAERRPARPGRFVVKR